jgi:GR25 family glycosyltransferase involved in LPS biosynthesis
MAPPGGLVHRLKWNGSGYIPEHNISSKRSSSNSSSYWERKEKSLPLPTTIVLQRDEEDKPNRSGHNEGRTRMRNCCPITLLSREQKKVLGFPLVLLLLGRVLVVLVLVCILSLYTIKSNGRIQLRDKYEQDPVFRAKYYTPIEYLRIRYFEPRPWKSSLRNFTMNHNNSFVIHMEGDKDRWNLFQTKNQHHQTHNKSKALQVIQIYQGAVRWTRTADQRLWEERIPAIRQSFLAGNSGDAGCAYSHLKLLQQLIDIQDNDDNDRTAITTTTNTADNKNGPPTEQAQEQEQPQNYYFVFEDDARILEPLASTLSVVAPHDADLIVLTKQATAQVRVPFRDHGGGDPYYSFVTRVTDGYGTFGYVITAAGARKLLHYMSSESVAAADPIDVAMMSVKSPLKVYIPTSNIVVNNQPQVRHIYGSPSVRKSLNGWVKTDGVWNKTSDAHATTTSNNSTPTTKSWWSMISS